MSLIKNIKNKFIKTVPETVSRNVTFSEDDIGVLAYMCLTCKPLYIAGLFGKNVYSYYIPYDKSNIDLAQSLFAKNGIKTEKHMTTMISSNGIPALRVQINPQYETDDVYRFMNAVNEKFWYRTRKEHLYLKSLYDSMKTK